MAPQRAAGLAERRAPLPGMHARLAAAARRAPKFLPTMQCHVGPYLLSNSFLT